MAYASGKHAYGISDRSGRRYRLREMKTEWTGAKVGPDEFEAKQPQLSPPRIQPDPQALRISRPARTEPPVEVLLGFNPFSTLSEMPSASLSVSYGFFLPSPSVSGGVTPWCYTS